MANKFKNIQSDESNNVSLENNLTVNNYIWTKDGGTNTVAPRYDTSFYVAQSNHFYGHTSSQTLYLGESGNIWRLRGTIRVGSNAGPDSGMVFTASGSANATSSFRAPLFYDSDDTNYYVDPSNGANGVSANLQGRIQVGTFNQSQTNTGEAWIGRAADRSAGVLTVQLGTGTGRKFEVVDYGWNTVEFSANDNGTAYAANDFRAPIFYDSNSTTYYVNPSSRSNFGSLDLNSGGVWDATTQGTSKGALHLDPGSTTDHAGGAITWGASDTSDGTTAHAGIYVRSDSSYGTRMYFSTTDSYGTGSKTAMNIQQNGQVNITRSNLIVNTDVRAPIFYDSNDTTYYVDPGSISILSQASIGTTSNPPSSSYALNLGGNIDLNANDINYVSQLHFNDNVRFYDDGNDNYLNFKWGDSAQGGIKFIDGDGVIQGYVYGSGSGHFGLLDKDGNWFVFTDGATYTALRANDNEELIVYTDRVEIPGDIRAPYFYDKDDTGYYVNPASTSRLNSLDMWSSGVIFWYRSGGNAYQRADARLDGSDQARLHWYGNNDTGSTTNFKHAWYDGSGYVNVTAASDFIYFDRASGTVSVQADGSFRAPIFYDSNDTSYYIDPTGSTSVNVEGTIISPSKGNVLGTSSATSTTPVLELKMLSGAENLRLTDGNTLGTSWGPFISFVDGGGTRRGYVQGIGTSTTAMDMRVVSEYGTFSVWTGDSNNEAKRFEISAAGKCAINATLSNRDLIIGGSLQINGTLYKNAGSFAIDHPLESKKQTHKLVHSFIEGPQADNIYRGKATLVNGVAEINIDEEFNMTQGTFTALNTNVQCFTTNESNWDLVKGTINDNVLTIESQNTNSTATISWLVIGERQDDEIKASELTDDNGKIIVEPTIERFEQ